MRMDYLRPYSLAHAVQSFTVLSEEPEPQFGYEDSPPNPGGVRFEAWVDRAVEGRLTVDRSPFHGLSAPRVRVTSIDALSPQNLVFVCAHSGAMQ